MIYLNKVHFGHIQTEMLLIHISRTFLESLGIGKFLLQPSLSLRDSQAVDKMAESIFSGHDAISFRF